MAVSEMNRVSVIEEKMETSSENPSGDDRAAYAFWDEIAEPLILMMKITGVYHEASVKDVTRVQNKPEGSGWCPDPEPSRSRNWLYRLSQSYHAVICIYLLLNAIRMTYSVVLDVIFGGFQQDQITLCIFYFNVTLNNAVMFAACYRKNGLLHFRHHWNSSVTSLRDRRSCSFQAASNLKRKLTDVDLKVSKRQNKFAIVAVVIISFMILLNTAAFAYFTFAFGTSSKTAKMICGPWTSEIFCSINMTFAAYVSAAYVLPVALYSLVCYAITKQFSSLAKEFDQVIKSPRPMDKTVLNCFRRRHAIICHTVEVTDDIFSPVAGVMYVLNVSAIIFLLYQLFYLAGGLFFFVVTSFWLLSATSSLFVLSYFAVQVYEKAHSLRRRVHELQLDKFDSDLGQIQTLFLARLDGPEIGMTALGCFVITKEQVLSVVSTLITFFTILLQFQGSGSSQQDVQV